MTLMSGSLGNGKERSLRVDKMTHGLITIPYEHHEIHDGSHYEIGHSDQLASTGDHIDVSLALPGWTPSSSDDWDTTYHAIIEIWGSVAHSFTLYEDCTTVSGGVVKTPRNNNRMVGQPGYIIDKSSSIVCTAGVLTRTGGSIISGPAYHGARDQGANNRSEAELILRNGSLYIATLTQLVNAASNVGIKVSWYETTPKY